MQKGQLAIVGTLIVAVGLGAAATIAILTKARQRVALVDELPSRMPPIERMRQIAPWRPAADGDDAHATYCLDDDADTAAAVARLLAALQAAGWTPSRTDSNARTGAVRFQATGAGLRLRGVARHGSRPDCSSDRRQTVLAVEALREPS